MNGSYSVILTEDLLSLFVLRTDLAMVSTRKSGSRDIVL